jgi:hypothetical protein
LAPAITSRSWVARSPDRSGPARYSVQSLEQAGGDRVDHTLYTLLLDRTLSGRVFYDATATASAILHDVQFLLATRH